MRVILVVYSTTLKWKNIIFIMLIVTTLAKYLIVVKVNRIYRLWLIGLNYAIFIFILNKIIISFHVYCLRSILNWWFICCEWFQSFSNDDKYKDSDSVFKKCVFITLGNRNIVWNIYFVLSLWQIAWSSNLIHIIVYYYL